MTRAPSCTQSADSVWSRDLVVFGELEVVRCVLCGVVARLNISTVHILGLV